MSNLAFVGSFSRQNPSKRKSNGSGRKKTMKKKTSQ